MDRRCAAGALVALAACIATTAAAPTASNQTALDLYDGVSEGCYYNFQHYGEGDRIMTNEPCLNCTCHNRMLMCYLRVCPFTKPIGQDCSVEKRADQCCPIVTCPDVPVDLLTSTSTSSPSEYGETGLGKLDRYGCSINGKYFPEGSKVPPSPNKPCEHCYCIRNMTTCVMQECTLHVDGCTPIYRKDVCCPVRYSCDHPEDEIPLLDDMTTTVRPTPGFLLTTTTISPVTQLTQDCVHDDKIFADGALIKTEKACEHCYCMKGDIVCVVQECGTPMENEGKNCTSMPPREGQCCPDTYICEGDEVTTETKPDIATVTSFEDITTLSPPRRVSVEGSGYRSETDEPSTEIPIFEPDSEGSGEDQPPFKPTDTSDLLIPESETSTPFIGTIQDDIADKNIPTTTGLPESDKEIAEKVTTDAESDKEMAEKATTEAGPYNEIIEKATTEAGADKEMAEKVATDAESEKEMAEKGTTEAGPYNEIIEKATTEAGADKEMAEKVTTDAESEKEMVEKATTEAGSYNEIIEKATTEAGADREMAEKVTTNAESEKEMVEKATTEGGSYNEIIRATTEAGPDKEMAEKVTTDAESVKEIAEKATTEAGSYNEIVEKATTEAGVDKEMAANVTTEADKGENTVPSGDLDEDTSETHDKTSPEIETTTSKLEAATEPSGIAKTTVLTEDETSIEDETTPQEEITATESAPVAKTTIAVELNTSPGSSITSEGEHGETTIPTRRKEDDRVTPIQITTLKYSAESTTKATDLIAPDTVVTESTTASFIEQGTETSSSKIPEKDVDRQEPTTEENLELTTKFDVIKTETQSSITVQPEIVTDLPTPGKVDFTDTTSANPIENEIDEETFPTLAPGRIPGEGDCLLDGVTYSHESIVPSTSNCHTSCRCISSIVKCEPMICSPPPDYMDNCQPMYDSSESCCPTYICDHPRETVPPQSHSQMAGTENPVPTPTIECDGDQCEVVKDKEGAKPPASCTSDACIDDSSKQQVDTTDCGPQGCGEVQTKPEEPRPLQPAEECAGDSCSSPPALCTSDGCTDDSSKNQVDTTDCGPQGCGEVQIKPEEPRPLEPAEECAGDSCSSPPASCTSGGCTDDSSKKQVNTTDCGPQGCGEVQTKPEEPRPLEPAEGCAGGSCSSTPVSCTSEGCTDDSSKKHVDSTHCGPQGCGEVQTKPEEPRPLETAEACAGDSCTSPPVHCASGNCETPIPKDQTCNNENGCEVPVIQKCEGGNCAIQPEHTATKDDATPCDNPESCKDVHIPDKASDCEGESCIFKSPAQNIPQEKPDCKDGDNCVQQTPLAEECNEEDCKRQQVPDIDRPPSDCTGIECVQQQDNEPQITDVPEIYTESSPKVSGLPEESDIKLKEPVTDLPKMTGFETDTEPSATTIVPIPGSEEKVGTTSHYNESDINKEKEPEPIVPESPEIVTPEGQNQESVTEGAVDIKTTMVPLQDITTVKVISEITPPLSKTPSTETPSLPDKDTKEITTEHPSFVETKSPESMNIDVHTETSVTGDAATDKGALDITTTAPSQPTVHSTSPDINQETTESQEMLTMAPESLDRDGHEETTKEPEYVQDSEPKVTEPYTSAPEKITDKLDVEPITEQESQGAPTTPKSYESQTNVPDTLETEVPVQEILHSSTSIPETQTTSPQEEEKKESELPVSTLTSEQPITDKPDKTIDTDGDVSSSDKEAETKSPLDVYETTTKPEIALDGSETQAPELNVTPSEESITKVPVDETEIETESYKPLVTLPQETATAESDTVEKDTETPAPQTVNVPTQTPMSIVKDYGDDEISSTITPESGITLITKAPESPDSEQSTESITKHTETPSEKPVSEFDKMPNVNDEEHASATTEKSGAGVDTTMSLVKENEPQTKQPEHDTDVTVIPDMEASTDSTPVSMSTIMETISSEPSVTETSIQESSAPQEEISEIVPITSIPREDMETKSPIPVTESSVQPISVGVEIITPTKEQTNETTDATELPELVIHEHPTEPSSIIKESDQPATEDTATYLPDMAVKEEEITPGKDTSEPSYAPTPHDDITVAPEIPTSESQKEVTVTSQQEFVTKMPEFPVSEKDDLSHIPESSPTESQKEVTEGSQAITTNAPDIAVTDAQKEATETPEIQTTIYSGTKISETEPQDRVTEAAEVQYTVTDAEVLVTQPHKHTTDAPVSYDMITKGPDMDTELHKESTDKPKESEMEPQKETTGIHDITTTVPEISPTESQKEVTEDTATKVSDIPSIESDKEDVNDIEPDNVTSVPKTSATEPQDEPTAAPQAHDVDTNVPETESKKEITESSVVQDLTTTIPTVTENVPLEDTVSPIGQDKATTLPEIDVTKPQKESTKTPTHDDTSTNVPDVHTTESQKEVTDGPEDVATNVPDTPTESEKHTQSPEPEGTATSAPKLPETEPKKETTETPAQEAGSTVADKSETEPKKEVTEMPETDTQEISDDSKDPATTATESQREVTNVPEAPDAPTNAPEVHTESHKEVTERQETPGNTATEPHDVPTETPLDSQNTPDSVVDLTEVLPTESQKEATEIPDLTMTFASNAPETLATKSDEDVTKAPEQDAGEVTKTPELEQTAPTEINAEAEKPSVTEKDETLTETPLRITTKFDDHTKSEPQEIVTSTESSKIESETSLSTESGSPVEQFTKVTELLMTESPDKTTGSDSDIEKPSTGVATDDKKPEDGQEIDTEAPFGEPTKTESPISPESEPETKAPELMESETSTTIAPVSSVTEKQDHTYAPENEPQGSKRTEATSAPGEEEDIVTKTPQTLEPQDKTTKISEEPEQTSESKEKYPETTPYLVLLEEHTHKTVSPDEDITASSSDVPLKEYETSTPEVEIDRVTEPASSSQPEKSPEDEISDKDQSVPELTQTTISEKITESSRVPEEITTIYPLPESISTEKPQYVESNEISTSAPMTDQEQIETEKPSVSSVDAETDKEAVLTSQKPPETTAPEEEFIYATTKATTIKEEPTTLSPVLDKFGKPVEKPKPAVESEKPKPDTTEELPKPGANEVQPTEEAIPPEEESHFAPSGTSGYGQEPDYGEEDSFGPGTCRYGGKVYVSAQQIPRDDPCDFCFCFRSDIICLQQSCPPPIHGCHEEPIQGFCCPRYECPVSMATTLNVTTTTTTTTTTLPPHFLPHAYKGAAQRRGCQIKGHTYKVGEVVRASSGPCLHCTCGGDGQMKCDPKVCTPEPMLRQMIAAAVSAKRRR